jgi:hypothetical protein
MWLSLSFETISVKQSACRLLQSIQVGYLAPERFNRPPGPRNDKQLAEALEVNVAIHQLVLHLAPPAFRVAQFVK